MDDIAKCTGYHHKMDYCYLSIRKDTCKGCPYFENEWKSRLKESQHTYCILYEARPMCECKGAKFNNREGRYECKQMKDGYSNLAKYLTCPYKTIKDEFKQEES